MSRVRFVQARSLQAAVWLGSKFVGGMKAADSALVNANALASVDELKGSERFSLTDAEARSRPRCPFSLSYQSPLA